MKNLINNHKDFKKAVIETKNFVEVSEEFYYDNLEVLPPVFLSNGCFQVDECVTDDLYSTFGKKDGKYYGTICNKNFALNNF